MLPADQARDLVEHFGGVRPAARGIGVPRTTLRYWLDPQPTMTRMARNYAEHGEAKRARWREYYWERPSLAHNRHLLQQRRSKARRRRAEREQRRRA